MWERGRAELTAIGMSQGRWLEEWINRIARADAVAFGADAILGWDWEAPRVCCSAFQASREFDSSPAVGSKITKEMRRAIPKMMRGRNVREVNVYSLCVTPDAPRWFRLLGFEEDLFFQGEHRGPHRMRKFTKRD